MTTKQSYLTPFLWFTGWLWATQFVFLGLFVLLSSLLGAYVDVGRTEALATAIVASMAPAIAVGFVATAVASKVGGPSWLVIPGTMGLVSSRFPPALGAALKLPQAGGWAWLALVAAGTAFVASAALSRRLSTRTRSRDDSLDTRSFRVRVSAWARSRRGLLIGWLAAMAIIGAYLWYTPYQFVGVAPLSAGRHDSAYFNRELELKDGHLSTTMGFSSTSGRDVRYAVHSNDSTIYTFDGLRLTDSEFVRRYSEDGYLDSVTVGDGGLLLRVEASTLEP
jgi:hypothetical protein